MNPFSVTGRLAGFWFSSLTATDRGAVLCRALFLFASRLYPLACGGRRPCAFSANFFSASLCPQSRAGEWRNKSRCRAGMAVWDVPLMPSILFFWPKRGQSNAVK